MADTTNQVTIQNVSRGMLTLILAGKHIASASSHPHRYKPVKLVTLHQSKGTGELVKHERKAMMPASLHMSAGEAVNVDRSVVGCPDVKRAIARSLLKVIDPAVVPVVPVAPVAPVDPVVPVVHDPQEH